MGCGVDDAPPMYSLLRLACRRLLPLYFDQVEAVDSANLPDPGTATILAFSHSNDLADMLVLLSASETRYIRYGAASFLFKMKGALAPISFIANHIGAVPVVRAQDLDGDSSPARKAQAANKALADRMLGALGAGNCIALSPEGGSRFRVKLGSFAPGVGVFAERAVLREAFVNGRADFSVRIVPAGIMYTQGTLWRSAAMVQYGEPIIVDAMRLAKFGINADIQGDSKNQKHFDCVDDIMRELRQKLSSVALDIPGKPDDPDKSKILEGDFPVVRLGIVAARLAFFDADVSTLPHIGRWMDAVRTLAKALQKTESLSQELDAYQQELVETGLRDAQVRGRSTGSCCHLVPALLLAVLAMVPIIFAIPAAILFSPVLIVTFCLSRGMFKRANATQRFADADGIAEKEIRKSLLAQLGRELKPGDLPDKADIVRRRRNFDTISGRGKGILAVFYFLFLEFVALILGIIYIGKVAAILRICKPLAGATVLLALPSLLYLLLLLSMRALDEACALLRRAFGHWALAWAGGHLEELREKRLHLRQVIMGLEGVSDLVHKAQTEPRNCRGCLGRCRSDWMEALSLTEDLTLSLAGDHEDVDEDWTETEEETGSEDQRALLAA